MNNFIESVNYFINNNQILMTMIGVSGSGMLAFWVKDLPKIVFNKFYKDLFSI